MKSHDNDNQKTWRLKSLVVNKYGKAGHYIKAKGFSGTAFYNTINGTKPSWMVIEVLCKEFDLTYADFPSLPETREFKVDASGQPVAPVAEAV